MRMCSTTRCATPTRAGHCPICLTAAIGAVVGGGIAYGVQVAANISQNGLTVNALTEINWAAVGAGVAAGAVGGATFGLGTAVLGTGAVATLASGAASGAVAGQAAIATENVLNRRAVTEGLGDPGDILRDATIGGALAGVGYGLGRLARPAMAEAAPAVTGQRHHVLSNKIMRALEQHPTLRGLFSREDLVVQAIDEASHRGYQAWHRAYDREVVKWLTDPDNLKATREEFLRFLRDIYARPEMRQRFPDALNQIERLLGGP